MKIPISSVVKKLASFIEVEDIDSDEGDKPRPKMFYEPVKKTHKENIKPPREQLHFKKKWSPENKTEKMKSYMQEYRAEGRDLETNSPKSKYVKKPKV